MVADGMPGKSATKLGAEARNLCRKLAEGEPDRSQVTFRRYSDSTIARRIKEVNST